MTETASVGCNIVPTPAVTHETANQDGLFLSGRFVLCDMLSKSTFDLDTGEIGIHDVLPIWEWETKGYKSETDIMLYMVYHQFDRSFTHNLDEINGAQVGESLKTNPTRDDCKFYVSLDEAATYVDAEMGVVSCIITNQGRVAMVRVESLDTYGWASIELSFITWDQIVNK